MSLPLAWVILGTFLGVFVGGACALPERAHPTAPVDEPVTLLAEPETGAGPVLALIASAQQALWMEMYLLTDAATIDALAARRAAGCDVRVILEPQPYHDETANGAAYDRLAAAGVAVQWATPRFAFTHAKVMTIDHARLVVLTLNLTRAGLTANREYVAVDDAPADVAAADAIIAADLAGAAAPSTGGRVAASPGGLRPALAALVAGAARTLAVEMEELSDPALIDDLIAARARGVAVSVVLPAAASSAATGAAAHRLSGAGVQVRMLAAPTVHAKAIVADLRWSYVGSANLTVGSLDANREVGLLLDDDAAAALVGTTIAGDADRGGILP